MAGNQNTATEPIADYTVAEQRLRGARRADLADAFGIVFSVPSHGQDENGQWKYGVRSQGGMANREISAQFEAEMDELIKQAASTLAAKGLLTERQVDALKVHPYSVGPAAQEWPKILFDIYQAARPFLNDGASLLTWGIFFTNLVRSVAEWASRKERDLYAGPEIDASAYSGSTVMPRIVLTRPAIVALCFMDVVQRHGVSGAVTVESFPRTFTTYETVDHPGGDESYLIRLKAGRRSFFYHVHGTGEVDEHYLLVGSTLTLLPLPDLLGKRSGESPCEISPSQRIRVNAILADRTHPHAKR